MQNKVKAILFDLYGTLAYIPKDAYKKTKLNMAKVVGCDASNFLRTWRSFTDLSTCGKILSTEERVLATLSQMNVNASVDQIQKMAAMEIALQENEVKLFPVALKVLSALQKMKFKTALITNCSSSALHVPEKLGLTPLLNAIVLSFQEHIIKPDPKIYELACSRIHIPPKNCIFVGDGDCNELDGARALGITTVLVKDIEGVSMHIGSSSQPDFSLSSISELLDLICKFK